MRRNCIHSHPMAEERLGVDSSHVIIDAEFLPDLNGKLSKIEAKHQSECQQRIAEILTICDQLLEFAQHGDYSNGNVAQGVDEGNFIAGRRLEEIEKELKELKAKYVKGEK